jgi:beta-galactosidase
MPLKNNIMQKKTILLVFLLCFTFSNAQKKINFDEGWKFHFGHAANPDKDFNYSTATIYSKSGGAAKTAIDAKFVDTTWTNINLPHDWAVALPFENSPSFDVESHGYKPVGGFYPKTSIGWYRKHFDVDKTDSNKRFEIQFDGIFRNANIWVNGFFVGNNFSGYVGKSYDITDYLNFDKENVCFSHALGLNCLAGSAHESE